MTYLHLPAEGGDLLNYERLFALAPAAYAGWQALATAVRDGMDERRYELVTITAACALGSRYCTLAHQAVVLKKFYDDAALAALLADRHAAGLDPADVAAMDYAELIAVDPATGTAADVERLRAAGLSEADVLQVVLAVCARRFFAGVLEAVGAVPDARLEEEGQPCPAKQSSA